MIIVSTHILTYAHFISVYPSDLPAAVCHLQILHNLLLPFDILCIAVVFENRNVLIRWMSLESLEILLNIYLVVHSFHIIHLKYFTSHSVWR